MTTLSRIRIEGFKSIRELDLELRPINLLIGGNGSGKSNLLSFFTLLHEAMWGRFQLHVAVSGGASALLHFGPTRTSRIVSRLEFASEDGKGELALRWNHASDDRLVFEEEELSFLPADAERTFRLSALQGPGESGIPSLADRGDPTSRTIRDFLNRCRVYHFHDTSPTSRIKQTCQAVNDAYLLSDAGNLAAILHRMKATDPSAYERVRTTVRFIAPYFDDFHIEPYPPESGNLILRWRQRRSDLVFGAHQLSDGTLRAICLLALMELPAALKPDLYLIDEPELGLHPAALRIVASKMKIESQWSQFLVATQSSIFVDEFESEEIVIVDRENDASVFQRPNPEHWRSWREEYSPGEIWEKNVFGGGPG